MSDPVQDAARDPADAAPDTTPDTTPGTTPARRPHPVLPGYYARDEDRPGFVRDLFDRTASDYDRLNRVFSLGTGGRYRREALLRAGLRPGHRVLDVAVGTGLVAREAVRVTGQTADVTGVDVSLGMLVQARAACGIGLIQGRAEALPLHDASVDMVTMGYALRHVADLLVVFREYHRVLRPGGSVLLLEIGRPEGRRAHGVARFYLGRVIPVLCRLALPGRDASTLMGYHWDTIEACVPPEAILAGLRDAGFVEVECEVVLGIFRAYRARRPGG